MMTHPGNGKEIKCNLILFILNPFPLLSIIFANHAIQFPIRQTQSTPGITPPLCIATGSKDTRLRS